MIEEFVWKYTCKECGYITWATVKRTDLICDKCGGGYWAPHVWEKNGTGDCYQEHVPTTGTPNENL